MKHLLWPQKHGTSNKILKQKTLQNIQTYRGFKNATAAATKSLQSCPTLCDPIDSSPPGFAILGILQARTLEWVAISISNTGKWKVKGKSLSRVQLFTTPWTAAHQAPPSMGFFQARIYWSGLPLPSPLKYATQQLIVNWINQREN